MTNTKKFAVLLALALGLLGSVRDTRADGVPCGQNGTAPFKSFEILSDGLRVDNMADQSGFIAATDPKYDAIFATVLMLAKDSDGKLLGLWVDGSGHLCGISVTADVGIVPIPAN